MIHIKFEMPQGSNKGQAVADALRGLAHTIEVCGIDAVGDEYAVVDVMFQTIGWAKIEEDQEPISYHVVVYHLETQENLYSYHNTLEDARESARLDLTRDVYGDTVNIFANYRTNLSEELIETLSREESNA